MSNNIFMIEWIDPSHRRPEDNQKILLYVIEGYVVEGFYKDRVFFRHYGDTDRDFMLKAMDFEIKAWANLNKPELNNLSKPKSISSNSTDMKIE